MVTFKHLIYGNVDSADYGVFINGAGVFNAPERAVEVVSIPGRNGSIAIDQGHWNNVTVEYKAGMFGVDQYDFAKKMTAFRNALKSQIGYQRLQDDYHQDEYRMAMFVDSFEVEPVNMVMAGQFTLKFNCKPQRFLTSGESEVTVTTGDELYNPTQYEAGPLIKAVGYGTISVEDYDIEIANATMGDVTLLKNESRVFTGVLQSDSSVLALPLGAGPVSESSDTITATVGLTYGVGSVAVSKILQNISVTTQPSYGTASIAPDMMDYHRVILRINNATLTFTKGTSSSTTLTAVYSVDYQRIGLSTTRTATITVNLVVAYDATNDTITLTTSYSYTAYDANDFQLSDRQLKVVSASVASTQSILGNPTYIDCDLGECYKIVSGSVVDLNAYIDLGSDLPVLKPGTNEITYDNTITSLKVVPGWWQL